MTKSPPADDTKRHIEYRLDLIAGISRLREAQEAFATLMDDDAEIYAEWWWRPPAWEDGADPRPLRQRAIANATRLTLEDDEVPRQRDPSEALSAQLRNQYLRYDLAPGLISASPRLIDAALAVNAAKAAVTQVIEEINAKKLLVGPEDDRSGIQVGKPLLPYLLHSLGLVRAHLHRIKRQLQVFEEAPESVGFTWASPRRLKSISIDELRTRLERLRGAIENDSRLQADWRIFLDLQQRHDRNEPIRLALINAAHTHPKANLTWMDGRRSIHQAVLPLLYPGEPGHSLVRAGKLGHWPHDSAAASFLSARRRQRSDVVFDCDLPLLQTLPVYAPAAVRARYYRDAEAEDAIGAVIQEGDLTDQ
ncbi:hypothetical protein ThidrDRAFT_1928 [Thiorhodococcus drewsii AZ1]|uniref:Uncharacterized protein n=1 Tax=Thiorhodococcus drewsii AZ1 TaxID=765913 RepID=G2E0V5_9GAMM|nr:DNA replication terminus site-binding protein [Thiorhodococcus drewsii]EGV31727.1 hypothetical protein ThidrDRAFT_1928 [Thiorhodococcus drewsii AZ1]